MSLEEMPPIYARQVGDRLRNIRRQQGLSLQAVEAMSEREFKASVLGAYERGERIISVLRLQRLARLFGVPVDQLLPRDIGPMATFSVPGPGRLALRADVVTISSVVFDHRFMGTSSGGSSWSTGTS